MNDAMVYIALGVMVIICVGFGVVILNAIKPIQQQLNQSNQQVVALQQQVVNQQQTLQQSMTLISALSETIKANEKSMGYLNHNINQFNKVLNDKKVRGVFGEAQLENIYASIFGVNSNMYAMQYHLPNNTIVDSVIRMPGSDALLCVDAKFPLENYNKMMEYDLKSDAYSGALKAFKQDIKIKINSIAEKYIIDGFTCDYALMFIPSVSVYDTIVEYCIDCMEYAFAHHVMLVSPINLMMSVEMIKKVHSRLQQVDNKEMIIDALVQLKKEFILFKSRSHKVEKDLNKVLNDYHELMITSDKLTKKFELLQ